MITPAKLLRTALLTVAVSAVCMIGASAASGVGTVNTDALRLRSEANTTSTILGTASLGDTVVILEDAGNGWYKVDCNTVEGYMSGEYLTVTAQADVTIGYGLVQTGGSTLNVRSGPGTSYGKVTSLNDGAVVTIVGIDNGWYKIQTSGGTTGSAANTFDDVKETAGKVRDFIKAIRNKTGSPASHLVGEDLDANNLSAKSIEFTVNVQVGIILKYNTLDNTYVFSEAALAASAGIEVRLQHRFTPVPILYVYAQFSAELGASTGLAQERRAVLGDEILKNQEIKLTEGSETSSQYYFTTDKKGFQLPTTGGAGTWMFTIGGIVLIAAAGGVFFALRRKSGK